MERALALERLAAALAEASALPSPEELANILGKAEVALFLGRPSIPSELIATAWYLVGVAQAPEDSIQYSRQRRVEAWRVSAHIFDLALADSAFDAVDRLRFAFASQLGYLRGGLHPNAVAIYGKVRAEVIGAPARENGTAALGVGISFLGMARRELYSEIDRLDAAIRLLEEPIPEVERSYSPHLGLSLLLAGVRCLMRFLLKGDIESLREAEDLLRRSTQARSPLHSLDLRWVSSSLEGLIGELNANSPWTVLPPGVTGATRRAFTYGKPPILSFWPPQRDILAPSAGGSPLDPSTRRVVLGVPTSGGKTLVSQVIAVDHVANDMGGACFIVPTRSLARELASSLGDRLVSLRRQASLEVDEVDFGQGADVTVMTPEKLSVMIRSDLPALLDRFSLFIFDEAHALANDSRGFVLEWCIAVLNAATKDRVHKIILMSAAIGNKAQIALWLSPDGHAVTNGSSWRGPRRVHAIYSTQIDWSKVEYVPRSGRKWTSMAKYPLYGLVRLRMSSTAGVEGLRTTEPLGERLVKVDANGNFEKTKHGTRKFDPSGTPFYKTLAIFAGILGESGPVLAVCSTRKSARRLAQAIAEGRPPQEELAELRELVRQRLGDEHPLAKIVDTGVVYHHGGLPPEVLEMIEQFTKKGAIRFIVATSGLIDGVNLPVRTVIVEETSSEQEWSKPLTPAQMINAFGRAGRSCMESEGWAVLARQAAEADDEFDRINPSEEELAIQSSLLEEQVLHELAAFEQEQRRNADALFECASSRVGDFITFVWSVLAIGDEHEALQQSAEEWVTRTLAWTQLDPIARDSLRSLAAGVEARFNATDPDKRRRWGRSARSIPTAKKLDEMAETLARHASSPAGDLPQSPQELVELLATCGVLAQILTLQDSPRSDFYDRPGANRKVLPVDLVPLLTDWVSGVPIGELAERHLGEVADHEYRHEQMGDFLSSVVEHHLSGVIADLLDRANAELAQASPDTIFGYEIEVYNPVLARLIRHGVSKPEALELLRSGIKSRTFAQRVAIQLENVNSEGTLRERLSRLEPRAWRVLFAPSRVEYGELLHYVRDPHMGIFATLVDGREAEVPILAEGPLSLPHKFQRSDGGDILLVSVDGSVLGRVAAQAHSDVASVLDTDLPYLLNGFNGEIVLASLAEG